MPSALPVILTDVAEAGVDLSRGAHGSSPAVSEAVEALEERHEELQQKQKALEEQIKNIEQVHTSLVGHPIKAAARRALTWHLPRKLEETP